jgi:Fe-S oxidoreductase/nitrate reductase gamma subunit
MLVLLVAALSLFAWSTWRRLRLVLAAAPMDMPRLNELGRRLSLLWDEAFRQRKLRSYPLAGLAHQLIFLGFLVLLLRSVVLFGRGFDPGFNLFVLGPQETFGLPLGTMYRFIKEVFVVLVLAGTAVFLYYRLLRPQERMSKGPEGILILTIIAVMMVSDVLYDAAAIALREHHAASCAASAEPVCRHVADIVAPLGPFVGDHALWTEPVAALVASSLEHLGVPVLVALSYAGYFAHVTLVLVFLNVLPYSKHFHVITAMPNVFLSELSPSGRLKPLAASTEALLEKVDVAAQGEDMLAAPIGLARAKHLTQKDVLDLYSCTECGRCSDHCPAHLTGKTLSPKQLTLDLRDHLYRSANEVLDPTVPGVDLVPTVIDERVPWGCTTCRACEEQCPVGITYVRKIVALRQSLVMMRGEPPPALARPFEGMEVNGNPWGLARMDRTAWTKELEVPLLRDKPDAAVLLWVGCAAAYDERAQRVARAMVLLLQQAKIDFAILGQEETCTGDAARRAGNEYLFSQLAEANVATLNRYQERGGVSRIVTICPHCYNTLKYEYPDYGGSYDVLHHSVYLLELVEQGKLRPEKALNETCTFHDPCYLGRHGAIYDEPRALLAAIPGLSLREPGKSSRERALCCGAGGAQMWMEEENADRINVRRAAELIATGASTVATACPFCCTMLGDGIQTCPGGGATQNLDVAELLAQACGLIAQKKNSADGSSTAEHAAAAVGADSRG